MIIAIIAKEVFGLLWIMNDFFEKRSDLGLGLVKMGTRKQQRLATISNYPNVLKLIILYSVEVTMIRTSKLDKVFTKYAENEKLWYKVCQQLIKHFGINNYFELFS